MLHKSFEYTYPTIGAKITVFVVNKLLTIRENCLNKTVTLKRLPCTYLNGNTNRKSIAMSYKKLQLLKFGVDPFQRDDSG